MSRLDAVRGAAGTMGRNVRRRGAPGGRAAVGGLLVTLAAVGVFTAYRQAEQPPTTAYVVVRHARAAGDRVRADDLALVAVDLPATQSARAFRTVDEVDGAVALTALADGDLVLRTAVLPRDAGDPGPEAHEFSFSLDRDHAVNGELARGEITDVLATYGTGESASTVVAARRARVVSLDDGSSGSIGSPGTVVVTLALSSPDEVLQVAHAAETGAVTLVRATRALAPLPDQYRAP